MRRKHERERELGKTCKRIHMQQEEEEDKLPLQLIAGPHRPTPP